MLNGCPPGVPYTCRTLYANTFHSVAVLSSISGGLNRDWMLLVNASIPCTYIPHWWTSVRLFNFRLLCPDRDCQPIEVSGFPSMWRLCGDLHRSTRVSESAIVPRSFLDGTKNASLSLGYIQSSEQDALEDNSQFVLGSYLPTGRVHQNEHQILFWSLHPADFIVRIRESFLGSSLNTLGHLETLSKVTPRRLVRWRRVVISVTWTSKVPSCRLNYRK